jgi:hypothetical protein
VFFVFYTERFGLHFLKPKEAMLMMGGYARAHVLLCLIPAFFITEATVFLKSNFVT